ncbi:PP2C family protein-serine/threonine phosphatase [Streptomyces thermolineatus]|uniref:PP2C family protein-serine/threonine phosphatase n=1 Tax=Streptomyces thermolineatus TaxID=44033 RepID=A0ABN3LEQ9_9ACTN
MTIDRPGTTTIRTAVRLAHFGLDVLPLVWVVGVCAAELALPRGAHLAQLLAAAPAVACVSTARRRCVLRATVCAVAGLGLLIFLGTVTPGAPAGILLSILAVSVISYFSRNRSDRLQNELDRTREIAEAAQQALLRPLPAAVGTVGVAGEYLSATHGAKVGGDLYEVLGTPYGLRAVLGDVRGHGLPALGTVAALLGSFREAAHDEPGLDGVLRRMERAFHRHLQTAGSGGPDGLGDEEFVTLLLVELQEDGAVRTVNCGHPWPLRTAPGPGGAFRVRELAPSRASLPLGMADPGTERVPVDRDVLAPGETLLMFTDGAEDARNPAGEPFPLAAAVASIVQAGQPDPRTLVAGIRAALMEHADGRLPDDVAVLALHRAGPVRPPALPEAALLAEHP